MAIILIGIFLFVVGITLNRIFLGGWFQVKRGIFDR